jgi:Icc-related predicted phosphoesterase
VEKVMKEAIVERTRQWIDLLVERIDTKKIKAIMMPGNDDHFEVDDVIKAYEDEGVIYPLDKVVDIAGFETISLDYTNPTPWNTPREASEKELEKKIDKLVDRLSDPTRSIFNFHCPPYNTRLDLAPELDKQMKPVLIGGKISMIHVGSKAVREAIEKYRPMIGLHGHIHESHAVDKIADVPILNPGSEYGEGLLRGFIIEMSNKGVERYWKVEG